MMQGTGVSGYSLKDVMKRRLISDMVRFVQPAGKWKIMVVDPLSMKVLNTAVKMYDILDENVTLMELITKKRQPYPTQEAIYFLSPTPEAIAYFIIDFCPGGGKPPLYAAAHLFFTGALPDNLMQRITTSGAARYIKNLKELFVDFLPLEGRVFSLDSPASFFRLFSPDSGGLHAQNQELDMIAKRLTSVLTTVGDFPFVRYYKPLDPENTRSAKLAHMVLAELENLTRLDPSFPPSETNRGTLIILDRGLDMSAPILHEFTYQAMAYDLLPMEDGKFMYAGSADSGDGKKEVVLDDNDQLWVQLRHMHIADTINTIMSQFNKFISENKAASAALGGGGGGATSLKDMKDTLAAMPQFQELKQKYSIHINMAQECMGIFERRKLADTAAVEQDMATGETSDGGKPKNVVSDMVPLLDDPSVTPYDKVRLLMLYILFKAGVQDDDRRKLLDHANIPLDLAESITNMALLGVKLTRDGKRDKKKDDKKAKKKGNSDVDYELSRYVPILKNILEDHVASTLDADRFPYLGASPAPDAAQKTGGTSLRSTKPSWQKKATPTAAAGSPTSATSSAASGAKIYVFVIGGMTYSEIRSIYEVAAACNKELFIGSTHIVTPTKFIDDLKFLRNPAYFAKMAPQFGYGEGPKPLPDNAKGPKRTGRPESAAPAGQQEPAQDDKKKKKFLGLF